MHKFGATFLLLLSLDCNAAGSVTGKVLDVRVDENGLGFIRFDKQLGEVPAACIAGGHTSHLSFDLNSPGGNGVLSLALAAQASGKSIVAWGKGSCEGYGVVERWSHGWIKG